MDGSLWKRNKNTNGSVIVEFCKGDVSIIAIYKKWNHQKRKIMNRLEIYVNSLDVRVRRGAEIGSDHYLLEFKMTSNATKHDPKRTIEKNKDN